MRRLLLCIRGSDDKNCRVIGVPDDISDWAVLDAAVFHIKDLWPEEDTEIIQRYMTKEMTP